MALHRAAMWELPGQVARQTRLAHKAVAALYSKETRSRCPSGVGATCQNSPRLVVDSLHFTWASHGAHVRHCNAWLATTDDGFIDLEVREGEVCLEANGNIPTFSSWRIDSSVSTAVRDSGSRLHHQLFLLSLSIGSAINGSILYHPRGHALLRMVHFT